MPLKQKYRFKVFIYGKVQGVWFRKHSFEKASELLLNGFVMNMSDGSVYAEIQGSYSACLNMLLWFEMGSPHSEVSRIHFEVMDVIEDTSAFTIR